MKQAANKNIIGLFDLDGSLADYEGGMRMSLDIIRSPEEAISSGLHEMENLPHIGNRMRLIKDQPGWWLNLPRIESGFQMVNLIRSIGFDVHILTKGPSKHSLAWKEKIDWCNNQPELQGCPIHIVSSKSLVYGHLLFDDFPPYMKDWLEHRPRGLGIMPETYYNADFQHDQVVKWDGTNLEEIEKIARLVFERKMGEPWLD